LIVKSGEDFQTPQASSIGNLPTVEPTAAQEGEKTRNPASSDEGRRFVLPRSLKLARLNHVYLGLILPSGDEGLRIIEKDVAAYLANTPKVTPVAQRMAAACDLNLDGIHGSGPQGKITKGDVENAVAGKVAPVFHTPAPTSILPNPAPALPDEEIAKRIPLKGVRALIAERMGASVHTTTRVTLMAEVDATEFVALRERLKIRPETEWGFVPGYYDQLAKIAAVVLRKFPYMNARLAPDAIELMAHVNIGLAVDTDRGLLVSVVRDADRKSLCVFG
jgi:pyruvate dehydrogenase E2 component (dihydrolipoamide acetyltransferase)